MTTEDIYGNKAQYERFRTNLQNLLTPAAPANSVKGKRQYHVRNKANLLKPVAEGKVKYKKVGRQNQFWLVRKYNKEFS